MTRAGQAEAAAVDPRQPALHALAPRTSVWSDFVGERQPEIVDLLGRAYGRDDRGPSVHLDRLTETEPWLYVAEHRPGGIVGCSYVHRSGKRGATAVLPEFRGRGLGSRLLDLSLTHQPDQWAEVRAGDTVHQGRYRRAGFTPVAEWSRIIRLLGPLVAPLVIDREETDLGITYARTTFTPPSVTKRFVLMVHGDPVDRTANDGKNYLVG